MIHPMMRVLSAAAGACSWRPPRGLMLLRPVMHWVRTGGWLHITARASFFGPRASSPRCKGLSGSVVASWCLLQTWIGTLATSTGTLGCRPPSQRTAGRDLEPGTALHTMWLPRTRSRGLDFGTFHVRPHSLLCADGSSPCVLHGSEPLAAAGHFCCWSQPLTMVQRPLDVLRWVETGIWLGSATRRSMTGFRHKAFGFVNAITGLAWKPMLVVADGGGMRRTRPCGALRTGPGVSQYPRAVTVPMLAHRLRSHGPHGPAILRRWMLCYAEGHRS